MSRQLKVIVKVSKGSPLTGKAWVNLYLGGLLQVEKFEVTANFAHISKVEPNQIEFTSEIIEDVHYTLGVNNAAETIGPIQIYDINFFIDDQPIALNWQTAIKTKPLRFGGQPEVIITNPHISDPEFNGWVSVTDVSPGMTITWSLADLINSIPNL